jgi:hypothetical protein
MKYLVTYKIAGKEHKTKVDANTRHHAEQKVTNSLRILRVEPEEDETVDKLKKIFGMT